MYTGRPRPSRASWVETGVVEKSVKVSLLWGGSCRFVFRGVCVRLTGGPPTPAIRCGKGAGARGFGQSAQVLLEQSGSHPHPLLRGMGTPPVATYQSGVVVTGQWFSVGLRLGATEEGPEEGWVRRLTWTRNVDGVRPAVRRSGTPVTCKGLYRTLVHTRVSQTYTGDRRPWRHTSQSQVHSARTSV